MGEKAIKWYDANPELRPIERYWALIKWNLKKKQSKGCRQSWSLLTNLVDLRAGDFELY